MENCCWVRLPIRVEVRIPRVNSGALSHAAGFMPGVLTICSRDGKDPPSKLGGIAILLFFVFETSIE